MLLAQARRIGRATLARVTLARFAGAGCVAACAAMAGFASSAGAQGAEFKVSVASGPTLPLGYAAEQWTRLLAESGDARLVAKLHPGASLAGRDAAREFAALKDGQAEAAVASSLQWSLHVPALGVFALPWIAPDDRALAALAGSETLRSALAARLEAQGVVLVAIAPLAHRELATTHRAVRAPADMSGLRLRVAASPMLHEMFLALGVLPQAMPFAAAQAALAGGALDGQEGTPAALSASRTGAGGQKHLTLWGAVGDAMLFAVRKPVWEALSEWQRGIVRRTAEQAIAQTGALAREQAAVGRLAQNGVAVVRITSAGHDAFRTQVREVSARWREAIGADVVDLADQARAAVQAVPAKGS